ncbi:MAG: AEC family transporter [Rhodobacteraceae bacterium]|nr:AEC family transporter [Paracoccaceae bacterium]
MALTLLQTLPFFAIIALGYGAARLGFFSEQATAWLTRFVFYFALSAMLFRLASGLSLAEILDWSLVAAYLSGTVAVYLLAVIVARMRRLQIPTAAMEAQCAVIGNTGFLGVPMLAVLLGERAAGPVLLVLAVDLIVFSSLIVIVISAARDGRLALGSLRVVGLGLVRNPMIVSLGLGLVWSALAWPLPAVFNEFLVLLGGAATPGALFAIGASLASKYAERPWIASWITLCKLVLHPACVAFAALWLFEVPPFSAGVIIAAAALPVAGNVYILAQHYNVAPQRVSASILISTLVSVVSVPIVIALIGT